MEATTATGTGRLRPRLMGLLKRNTPLLGLQSDESLVALTRSGNQAAFEALVRRYQPRLLRFCAHTLGAAAGRDAEDVVQESFVAAYMAIIADERPIEVRPWLYRIARNRCLNQLRGGPAATARPANGNSEIVLERQLADSGLSAADQAGRREDLRRLVGDMCDLPESQRSALILRELEAMSYKQVAEAMSTTVPSVKSLLVRARLSLVDTAQGRELPCSEVSYALAQLEEGVRPLDGAERAHLKACPRCAVVEKRLKGTKRARRSRAAAALSPVGLVELFHRLIPSKLTGGSAAAGTTGGGAAGAIGAGGLSTGAGALATKAAAVALLAGTALAIGVHKSAPAAQGPSTNGAAATPVEEPRPVATPVHAETSASPVTHPGKHSNASNGHRPAPSSTSHHSPANAKSGPSSTAAPSTSPLTESPSGGGSPAANPVTPSRVSRCLSVLKDARAGAPPPPPRSDLLTAQQTGGTPVERLPASSARKVCGAGRE